VPARIQHHHVGRALVAVAPERGNGYPVLELRDARVGSAQPARLLKRAHRHRNRRYVDSGDHGADALGVIVGAVGEEGAVQGEQLVGRAGPTGEQLFTEVGCRIDLQQDVGQLHVADPLEDGLAGLARLGVVG
jgi:hypothetical protein